MFDACISAYLSIFRSFDLSIGFGKNAFLERERNADIFKLICVVKSCVRGLLSLLFLVVVVVDVVDFFFN